jgi:hypothetical protein
MENKMKIGIFLFAIFILIHQNAMAANWVEVAGSDSVTVSVDKDSMRKVGTKVKTWLKWEWVKPQDVPNMYPSKTYKTEKQLQVSDCANGTLAIAQGVQYSTDGNGEVVNSYTFDERAWRFSEAAPETIGESILRFACKATAKRDKPASLRLPSR